MEVSHGGPVFSRATNSGKPPTGVGMKRATSMLFDVLAQEEDAAQAKKLLAQATQRVMISSGNLSRLSVSQGQNKQSSNVTPTNGHSHASGEDSNSSLAANNSAQVKAYLQADTDASSQAHQQHKQQQGDTGNEALNGVYGADRSQAETHNNDVLLSSTNTQLDLEADRVALAEQLSQFTPEVILQELLGSLFIHPDRLTKEEMLGEGTYAVVHKATLQPIDEDGVGGLAQVVAVKQLKPEVLASTSDLKDFLLEVNIMRKLKHPNIVGIRGIGAADLSSLSAVRSSMFVVMEALEGGTLRTLVTRQMTSRSLVYEARDALHWAQHIASAMHYLHAVCRPMIIHRDMKLENVMLTEGPMDRRIAKLSDFGLHKRARVNTATGMLTAPPGTATTLLAAVGPAASIDDERSYYGGNLYNATTNNASVHYAASYHPTNRPLQAVAAGAAAVQATGGTPNSSAHGGRLVADKSTHGSTHGALAAQLYSSMVNQRGNAPSNPDSANNSLHNSVHAANALRTQSTGSTGAQQGGMVRPSSLKHLVDLAANAATTSGQGTTTGATLGKPWLKIATTNGLDLGRDSTPAVSTGRAADTQDGTVVHGGATALGAILFAQGATTNDAPNPTSSAPSATSTTRTEQQNQQPPVSLPAGMATLLSDPSQLQNLQSLHALLSSDVPPYKESSRAAKETSPAADTDVSVHRKMLALMALDVNPQGPYCAWPEASPYCPWPQSGKYRDTNASSQANQSNASSAMQGDGSQPAAVTANAPFMKAIPEDSRASLDLHHTHSHGGSNNTDMDRHGSLQASRVARPGVETIQEAPVTQSGIDVLSSLKSKAMSVTASMKSQYKKGAEFSGKAMFAEATQQVGSLMYMAPELVRGEAYNQKVDVFSFGIMLYELFVGKLVACKGELMTGDEAQVMAYVRRRAAGERERIPTRWPPQLRDLVCDCWAQNPAHRPSFKEIMDRLKVIESSGAIDTLIPSHIGALSTSGGCCTVM